MSRGVMFLGVLFGVLAVLNAVLLVLKAMSGEPIGLTVATLAVNLVGFAVFLWTYRTARRRAREDGETKRTR